MNSITSRLPRFLNKPSRQISIFIALLLAFIFSPIYLVFAIGTLNSSAGISGEPLVGGDITFSISVINLPDPPPGTYFTDRLYNITGEIVLPLYVTLGSCSIPPSSTAAGPGVGETTITFDNIKNLEVNEVITISCTATLGPLIDLGNPFTIGYRWESNTLPDESGTWVYSPGPGAGNYLSISAQPQAFDLEKFPNPNTGEVQVNGAGAYAAGAGGTGVNWPYDYTLTLTNNPLNPSTGLQVVDVVPPGVAYLGNDAVVCDSGSAPSSVTPARTLLGDGSIQLVWDFPSINPGEVCTIGYDTAIPYRYRTGADTGLVVGGGPFTGAIIPTDVTHINTYEATGNYQHPINGPTPSSDGTTSTPQDDVPATVTSGYHSIAKGVSSGDVLQDDELTYTIDGWISEYYDFTASAITPYVITDILPDGLDYCGTGPGVGPSGFYGECDNINAPLFNGAPLIPVSVAQDASFNLVITWHMTSPAAVQAGDTWQLVYDAQVRDFYAADPTQPVSGLDVRPNRAIASAEWNDRITVGRTGTDDTHASASVSLTAPDLDKQILDPVSGTFVDGPVEVEIGQRLTYRVAITFAEDLDMRNVIIDDFLPRGQRYIPNSADFAGSQDYPGAPQTAPGDYTGTTYGAEQFEAFNGFFIDDCPSSGRYPGPSDPFLTSPQFLGGLQDLVWRLCRVDNSDSGVSILWQVVFDAVVVDDPAIFEGYQIANFGNLSGTNSFGTTYSLRDNLDMTYIVPNLVTRKSNNAPNPLSVGSGTFAYTISIENVQQGTAYDWTIRDTVPAGIRVPGGTCTGFATTAPGAFECVADAGAQAGTGGFVTIRPVAAGVHDPARPFPGLTTYNFSFNSELAPDATPAESLTNTASVEYCTSATPDDLNADGTIDRRCIGYLDPDPLVFDSSDTLHSDEGTPPNFADFVNYDDIDDLASSGAETNGTDNSTVNIVEVGTDKSHTQPTHTPPQVVTGDFATIGEVYQVTLEITIPGRTHLFVDPVQNYVEIIDTFTDEGAIFCDAASAITGCADPVLAQPGALVTPNAATWWAANNLAPAVGSTVRFFFNEIDNSSADTDYTFTITFTMQVTGTDDSGNPVFFMPTTTDTVNNSFVVRYFDDNTPTANQYTTPPESDSINIDQPVITTDKEAVRIVSGGSDICTSAAACNGVTVQGGDTIYYQSVYTNSGESTAMDVSLIDQLPLYVIFNNDLACTSTIGINGGVIGTVVLTPPSSIELQMDTTPAGDWDIPPGGNITCTYSVDVETVVPAGTDLTNFTDADWSSIDAVPGPNDPPERIFDDTPDDGDGDEDEETVPVEVPTMGKIRTSPSPTGSPSTAPVRIGDVVQYQITIPLPIGETRNLIVTDTFDPGLILYTSGPAFTFVTNSTTLAATQTLNGTNDGIGSFSVDWGLSDPACTGTPPCIINDGVNNTAVTITFRAVVADVPLNINGLILDNTVSATYVDGNGVTRTANDEGPFDDEEVQIIEPQITLVKDVTPTTADAGDTLTYTVTITNPAVPTTSNPDQPTAYDVTWDDDLDNRVQYVPGSMVCTLNGVGTTAIVTGTDPIGITNNADVNLNTWDLRPGSVDTLVCTYQVLVLQSVPPAIALDNTADADWTSQDGVLTSSTTDPNERIYDDRDRDPTVDSDGDGDPTNDDDDGAADQDVAQVQVPNPTIDKIVGPSTDPNYQTDNQYQPGELIPYQITIVLPEGTTEQLTITDTFNANLQFEAGSTTISSVPAGVSIATGPTIVGNTATWVLNDIVYTGTPTTANPPTTGYTITLSYRMRVRNTATNGASYTNTASARYDVNGDNVIDANDPPAITDTATTNIETPVVTITKTENDADNLVDADDVITYTVTLTNTRGATGGIAYDVFFTENLDDDTDYVVGSMVCNYDPAPAGAPFTPLTPIEFDLAPFDGVADAETTTFDNFRVSGGAAENSNPWFLNGGDSIICTYQVTLNANVQAGDPSILNSVTVTYDTADNDQPQEVTTTSTPATTTLSVPSPTLTKDVDATATEYQADGTYQPGDLVPYVITVTVPEGQVTDLNVTDTIPTGFQFVSTASVTTSWAAALTPTGPTSGATGTVTWAFGNVSVPGTTTGPPASFETITIRFLLRVTTSAPSGTATNTAASNFDPPGTPNTLIPPDTADVIVVRPTLSVVKTADPVLVDAADVVTYTVVITNTSTNGAMIYDVTFTDDPNDFMSVDVTSFVCNINGGPNTDVEVTPNVNGADPFTVAENLNEDLNEWDLTPGDILTCTYNVVVDANVPATSTLTNVVTATGSTVNGNVAGEEDIIDDDDAQVNTFDPQIDKALDTTDTVYAPGEIVPYVVTIRVPEGAILDLQFTDTLPAGLRFDSMGPISGGFALVGGAPTLVSGTADGSTPATYRFDFVDPVIVPSTNNTNSIDYVNITVRYFARVTSTIDGATLINTVSGTYDTGNGANDVPIGTDTTTVTVEIPTQDTTKVITQIDPDGAGPLPPVSYTAGDTVEGGAVITYQVTLTNTDATATLYDVTLVENPPDLVSYNAGSTSCTLAGLPTTTLVNPDVANADPFTITNNMDENLNTWDLTPGQRLICTYIVTVDTNVPAGLNLINLVTGNGSSANGDVPDEIDIPDTATTTIPTSAPEILKSVADPIPPVVTIGQEIEYLLVMQLPIGITTDLAITDTLEGDTTNTGIDLRVVPGTTTITRGGVDISAGVTEAVTTNADGEQVITWDFTTALTYDPAAATTPDNIENIEIRFTVVVEDIANNNDGDILWNLVSAVLSPDGGTTIVNISEDDVTDNDVLLAVPALEVDKAHNDANGRVEPGQIVTYTVTVRNVGTGVAQNLIIQDLMPAGWTYVPNSSTLGLAAIGNPATAGQALTWNLDALVDPDPVLNGIGALVLTYQAVAPNPLIGSPYTNLAEASGNDSIGNPIPEDNTDHVANDTDPTDDAATTLTAAAAIQGVVWHDVDADGVIDATEVGIPGVTVQLYDSLGNLVATTTTSSTPVTYAGVTYPVGTYLFTDLPPGNYTIIELQTGPILNWESTADADTPPGTGATPDDYNEIAVTGLTAGEIREDQDFGERYAGLIQGFVYLDPNGDGSNTVPPGGGDTGIQNVSVSLYDSTGTLIATTTTDVNGYYQFPNLPDGTYTVIVDDNDTDITNIDPNIDFTPGAVNTVGGLIVDVAGGGPVPEAHFPFRTPAALAIVKTGYDLNGAPLLPGETVGWIVCVLNPDALAAPNVTVTDPIDTVRLSFVAGSIQTGIVATCPATAPPAGLTAQPAVAPDGTGTLTINYGSVPAGQYAVLYFETTVTDPFTWGGGWLSVLSLLVFGWLRNRHSKTSGVGAQRAAPRSAHSIITLILISLLVGGLSLSSTARSQEEGTPEVTESPAERTSEPIIIEATEESTPEATETPEVTVEVTDEATPEITETPDSTDEATPESTVEATTEATVEATAEAIVEATPEVTAEATDEAEPLFTLTGRVYDDTNASLTDDEGEPGIAGVTVTAFDENDTAAASAVTDENGVYILTGLASGDYTIRVGTLPDGYIDVLTLGERGEQASAPIRIDEIDPDLMTGAGLYAVQGEHFAYVRDTDGDGTPDGVEGSGDRDGDGIPNYLDPFDPSGVFYIVDTGNIVLNVDSALYADMDNNCTLDTSIDQLANTVQANPQTSTNGGYRYDIRITDATDPSATGIPDDGSSRCFFLEITSFPASVMFPSTVVPAEAGALTTGGAVVTSPVPPTPPVTPATHRFFLVFQIDQTQDEIINNHVAFDATPILLNQSVNNEATASRDGLPPVSDDDTLVLNNTLSCSMTPNGTTVLEPGQSYTFNHILTNTGTQTDTYTITYSTSFPAWTQSLTPAAGTTVTLAPGATQAITYTITVPAGTVDTTTNVTTITATSSTAPNPNCSALDVTMVIAACVNGILYNDTNLNGVQDIGESGLAGVTLNVFDSTNTLVATLVTAGDGSYNLGGLPSGTYRVEIDEATLPEGTVFYVDPNVPEQTLTVVAGGTCAIGSFGLVIYDPAITKNGTPDQAEPGDTIVFTITVTNNSTANITGVIVRDPLPSYFDFLSASTTAGTFTFNSGTNTVIFDIGTMTPGQVTTMVVRVRVNASAPAPGTVTNRAIFTYNEGSQQTASDSVTIPPPPPPPPGATPTPEPSPIPMTIALGSVPGTGVGGAVIPSQFPSQLPLTGSRPAPNGLAVLGLSFVVFILVAVGLAALSLIVFRNRIGAMSIAKLLTGFILILGAATFAGAAAFGLLWSDPAAPEIVQEMSEPQASRPQPTAVSIIDPSMLAGNAAIAALIPNDANTRSAITRSPFVSLASWNNQFIQAEIPATRIVIPALDIDTDLVEAPIKDDTWDVTVFTNEIAHLEGTAYLGTTGNAVIAGHITHQNGYGPFRYLEQLKQGDIILAYGDSVEYRYVVRFTHYIEPDDIEYALPMDGKYLTLISCAGWDQAMWTYKQRLIVRAELVSQ